MFYAFDPYKYPKKLVSSYWFSSASKKTQGTATTETCEEAGPSGAIVLSCWHIFPSLIFIHILILSVCTQKRNLSVWYFTLLSLQNCVKKTANQFHSQCSHSRRQFILTSDTCWLLLPIMPDAREWGCRNNSVDDAIKLVKILEVCFAWFSASSNSHHKQNSDTYSFFVNFLTGKEIHINSM